MEKSEQIMVGITDFNHKLLLSRKPIMERVLSGFSLSEISLIEYIASYPETNVTQIAAALYMTRGAISKLTKKLESRGILNSYQKNDNKKEIHFTLTVAGQEVEDRHRKLHQTFISNDKPVFQSFSDEELDIVIRFLNCYNQHLEEELK